jgi:hypothetical protein
LAGAEEQAAVRKVEISRGVGPVGGIEGRVEIEEDLRYEPQKAWLSGGMTGVRMGGSEWGCLKAAATINGAEH